MSYCVIIVGGMADVPHDALDNRTPLEAAATPTMNAIAMGGRVGTVRTIPAGLPVTADVGVLSILGYDPNRYLTGRAALTARALGLSAGAGTGYLLGSFITLDGNVVADHCAGHIGELESTALIELLNKKAAPDGVRFCAGNGYRFVLSCPASWLADLETTAPHDMIDQPIEAHWPRGASAERIADLLKSAHALLADHEINKVRADLGENPANMIWLWGAGPTPLLPHFVKRYNKVGTAVTSAAFVAGLGTVIGWTPQYVAPAAEADDGDYALLAQRGVEALAQHDLVVAYIEATDQAAHEGNPRRKVEILERIDKQLVAPLLAAVRKESAGRMLVVASHGSRSDTRMHSDAPVPFAMCGGGVPSVRKRPFHEAAADESGLHINDGCQLLPYFLRP